MSAPDRPPRVVAAPIRVPGGALGFSIGLPHIWRASSLDTAFLLDEIVAQRCYEQNGVRLDRQLHGSRENGNGSGSGSDDDRPVVIDVGANVGLFAAYAASRLGWRARVVAIEPIPEIFECLRRNADTVAESAGRSRSGAQAQGQAQAPPDHPISCLNCGIGDGSAQFADFVFYPSASGWSTMMPDDDEVRRSAAAFVVDAVSGGDRGRDRDEDNDEDEDDYGSDAGAPSALQGSPLARVVSAVNRVIRIPPSLIRRAASLRVSRLLSEGRTVRCPLDTISGIIDRQRIPDVVLLKIDVERAELAVLQGIRSDHWPRIHQVAMECHGGPDGSNLGAVVDILEEQGFTVEISQSRAMRSTGLYAIHSVRRRCDGSRVGEE